jgi:hypothetical protein
MTCSPCAKEWETDKIADIIRSFGLPPDVRSFRVVLGKDSSDEPSIWIDFFLKNTSQKTIETVVLGFFPKLRQILLSQYPNSWPYLRIR